MTVAISFYHLFTKDWEIIALIHITVQVAVLFPAAFKNARFSNIAVKFEDFAGVQIAQS